MGAKRVMPERLYLGSSWNTVMSLPMAQKSSYGKGEVMFPRGPRVVMGFQLPEWQRPLVWSTGQKISFIESLWKGVPVGTWTFNRSYKNRKLDDLLIDGQQRLNAIECYLDDGFSVLGYHFSEVTRIDRRFFDCLTFPSYITETEDEEYLKGYYNMMNFSGTAHTEDQRA